MTFELVVTCADGLEPALQQELGQLGLADIRRDRGAVRVAASLEQAYRICLWSRVASRVLLPLFEVEGQTPEALYAEAVRHAWGNVLDPRGTIAVHATAARGLKVHTQYLALKLKDAVVDHCREHFGARPDVDPEMPDVPLQVHAHAGGFVVGLDLAGESLHRRGYRVAMTEAPLKETLAAALLLQAGWPSAEFAALVDPMCGSGTFLIEAAWMAADIAPGILRSYYGFFGWKKHDADLWLRVRDEARVRREAGLARGLPRLLGSDADREALGAALRNAHRAGVADHVELEQRQLRDLRRPRDLEGRGLLITNPPYGERLGEKNTTREFYRALGRIAAQQLGGWQACVLGADVQHVDALGFAHRATERLHNGALTVYARHGDIPSLPATAVFRFTEAAGEIPAEAEAFANRLRKNLKAAQKQAVAEGVHCYRVYDADMPEFNLAVDVYEQQLHVQEYAPPKTVDPEKAEARFRLALVAIRHVFGLRREHVFIKVRSRQKGKQQYEKQASEGRFFEVRDGEAWVLVNLTDYLDTGLFLDHRPLRQRLGREARDRHFLNLFAYTGVASVHAALGGAASTTTVDLSPTYLNWARRNLALNGLAEAGHHFEQADCLRWLRDTRHQFDLIFIDPPTFSNSKRTPEVFDVQRDHVELVWLAMRALRPGGTLYFSNNFRKFRLDAEALQEFLIEDISPETIGFDFARNPGIHRCWKITHRS
ncbi:MAG TPA: bifunctional 23S rRNA (guanine(2069)-N(7))-methyltransferase RlmK/23S rRNA (guanine(2445)-N(2))-methyltransferase RlmL [Moraxellaceae bacterium]|nr:bifunctional 23S rRNA (guanine(2069)-N(7))-methyltransferase RlmK/23S rRNA (guanine(2445)-N(2))-methyltransferase RlmL [Moraxellaceae bacterium]